MKKIVGIFSLFFLFTTVSFAAANSTAKNEVSIPCYNSGLNFGLAGYYPSTATTPTNASNQNSGNTVEVKTNQNYQVNYQ